MRKPTILTRLTLLAPALLVSFLLPAMAHAHCDTLDGPVVGVAKKALETGDVNLALIWVQKDDEPEIKKAFEKTLAVRKLSAQAAELADMYFFETLVRIHRAGEGAPYTGLKPAGAQVEEGIELADKAIEERSVAPVVKLLVDAVQKGVRERFEQVMAKGKFNKNDVDAGREYVRAYVTFIHYVEGIVQAAKGGTEGHLHEAQAAPAHTEEH